MDFLDSEGNTYTTATNCAGNFFVEASAFKPVWPIWVDLRYEGIEVEMSSAIFREGSCAACHAAKASPSKVSRVYFSPDPSIPFPEDGCP